MFGFGKKEIEIFLEKYNYSLGENIGGKISLKLNKPTKAKALKVGLIGERLITETGRTADGKINSHQRKEYVFNFEMPLDGEKEYSQGEYNFEIKIVINNRKSLIRSICVYLFLFVENVAIT